MTEKKTDLSLCLKEELKSLRELRTHLHELRASAPGRLSVRREGGRKVYTHHFTDPLTGAARSRKLGFGEDLLKTRIKQARAAEKLLPVVESDIRALEKALKVYRAPDLTEAARLLGPAYEDIPL